jgi:hypothetical protein
MCKINTSLNSSPVTCIIVMNCIQITDNHPLLCVLSKIDNQSSDRLNNQHTSDVKSKADLERLDMDTKIDQEQVT